MNTDEGQMHAALVMREAADMNQRAADRIEEAVRQMNMIFDAGYGGVAPRLLEKLEDLSVVHPISAGMKHEIALKGEG